MSPGFVFVTLVGIIIAMIYASFAQPSPPPNPVRRAFWVIAGLSVGFGILFMVSEALSSGSIRSLAKRHRNTVHTESKDPVGFWLGIALFEFAGVALVGGSIVMLFRRRP